MSDEKKDSGNTYYAVAIPFGVLAVVFAIAMDNPATALPFAVLAISFLIIGSQQGKGSGAADEPGRDAEPEPDGDRP